ncbi:hypothetical protein LZ30DRAFT_597368 [Colletotrichum cereale]|nr:hypothetical protein LZ30DRAFT_597368 [Colletotrichum cereale]
MRFPTFATTSSLVLLALAKSALGCSAYKYCHCYNDDGVVNDVATQTVCNRFDSGTTTFADGECQYVGKESIYRGRYVYYYGMKNCDWRVMCGEAGATGPDSSCREMPPGNVFEYAHHS